MSEIVPSAVAGWQSGLKEEPRPPCSRKGLAADHDTHFARAVDLIDPVVRVTGMDEDLVVLLEPCVHELPVESDQGRDLRTAGRRIEVSPSCILDGPAFDSN